VALLMAALLGSRPPFWRPVAPTMSPTAARIDYLAGSGSD
jgi:hypothetical protein